VQTLSKSVLLEHAWNHKGFHRLTENLIRNSDNSSFEQLVTLQKLILYLLATNAFRTRFHKVLGTIHHVDGLSIRATRAARQT